MSLLENSVLEFENRETLNPVKQSGTNNAKDAMIINVKQVVKQESPMPENIKNEKRLQAESLENILKRVINEKGEASDVSIQKSASNELEIEGMSKTTLHSFLVKAEELGKSITYTRTLKVEITD